MSSTNKTAKLKLPQFTATDTPTWLTDVNNAFKAIDDNVGKVTRTATVVVGLESSGYTENQVDVLIKPTDNNVVSKINEAIGKLPAIGGEIKFLEGTYNINGEVQIRKDNILFSGVGNATKLVGFYNFWVIYSKNVFNKNIVFNRTNGITPISIQPNANAVFSMCEFNGISCQGICSSFSQCINTDSYNKTASNWRNIFVDGVAEYVALNTLTSLIGTSRELLPTNTFSVGDMIDISIRSSSAIQTSTQLVTMKYGQGSIIIRVGLSNYVPKTNNQYYVGLTVYSNLTNDGVYNYAGTLIDNMLAIDNIKIWRKAQ